MVAGSGLFPCCASNVTVYREGAHLANSVLFPVDPVAMVVTMAPVKSSVSYHPRKSCPALEGLPRVMAGVPEV